MIPVINENAKLKVTFAITRGEPITVADDTVETPHLVAGKVIKLFSKQ